MNIKISIKIFFLFTCLSMNNFSFAANGQEVKLDVGQLFDIGMQHITIPSLQLFNEKNN